MPGGYQFRTHMYGRVVKTKNSGGCAAPHAGWQPAPLCRAAEPFKAPRAQPAQQHQDSTLVLLT